jgi:hypothetical protein
VALRPSFVFFVLFQQPAKASLPSSPPATSEMKADSLANLVTMAATLGLGKRMIAD